MTTPATKRVDPLACLTLRAWARAVLVEACLMGWHEAIDGLWLAAERDGLDPDVAQKILAEQFAPYREGEQ